MELKDAMAQAELIDLNDFRKSGEGANGVSYDCIGNPEIMVKIYNEGYPVGPIIDELEVAKKVWEAGVPTPEPGDLVTDGRRFGIRFRRIAGKRSFSRIFADEPQRTEEFAREMARFCKRLHARTLPEGLFPDAKEQFRVMLAQLNGITEEERAFLRELIDGIPDCDGALHGDMHFGNIITTLPKGAPLSDPHETYFIDLGYFSHGHPLIDLGMMASVCHYSSDEFVRSDMHISKAHAERVFDFFLDEYFFGEDRLAAKWFGDGETLETIKKRLRRSYLVKSILITFNIGSPLPEFLVELRAEMESKRR